MKALKDLRRYDEDYDEGGYIGISVDHEGEYYKCSDVEALLEESMPKWVSVDEQLPDNFKLVIISQQSAVFTGTCEGGEWFSGNNLPIQAPEYWIPLPPALEMIDEIT